ncbi:MAG: hypothetical protein RBQ89_08900 [Sphaerochaeta sp.]|nr:hypothetical protein [Sphaerochaeta sp.]
MRVTRKIGLICTIIIVLSHITLFGNAITYDIATGTLQDFAINYNDNPEDPSAYMNSTPVWDHPGFLGRLIYTGEPTQLTFFNHGPTTGGSRFYFTGTDWSAQSSTGYYREFFIVARAKGLRHSPSNAQHDFSQSNTVITGPGQMVDIPYGAGNETVQVGQLGYNAQGQRAVFNGSNGYQYLYPYSHIWIDLTIIRTRTANRSRLITYYESALCIQSDEEASVLLTLSGEDNKGWGWGQMPESFSFSIEKTVEDGFPFSWLQQTSTIYNALEIAKVIYRAEDSAASIRFASDATGYQSQFFFRNQYGDVFPFSLAFDATKPNRTVVPITSSQTFETAVQSVTSPIDGNSTHQMHVLEGGVKAYLPIYQNPPMGLYSSTVYVFVEPVE